MENTEKLKIYKRMLKSKFYQQISILNDMQIELLIKCLQDKAVTDAVLCAEKAGYADIQKIALKYELSRRIKLLENSNLQSTASILLANGEA